jgi:cytochrome c peroxidase
MRKYGIMFKITKNRITKLALKDTKCKNIADLFSGPTAVALSKDAISSAKILTKFSKDNQKLKIVGGFMGKDSNKKFRVPILRDISKTAPYFHNGVVKTLREAIKLMGTYQIGVNLTPSQLDAMEEFLKSLDGELVDFNLNL